MILNEPELAKGHDYFRLGGAAVSPDARLLAYATDTNGSERFVLQVRDLATGTDLPDVIENWRYGIVWAADSKSFLYTDADENWRSKTVWHHRLGDAQSADRVVYREADAGIRRLARPHAVARLRDSSTAATDRATKYVFCRPAISWPSRCWSRPARRTAATMSMSATVFSISASTIRM